MKCLQATRLISDSQDRKLTKQEKLGVGLHLLTCPHCRKFKRHCVEMSELMKKFAQEKE